MGLLSAFNSTVDQLLNRRFLSSLDHSQKVFVHSARFTELNREPAERRRVYILVRAKGVVEAESKAEAHLQEILSSYQHDATSELELKRLKPHELCPNRLKDESLSVVQLLHRMRCEACDVVSVVEPISFD